MLLNLSVRRRISLLDNFYYINFLFIKTHHCFQSCVIEFPVDSEITVVYRDSLLVIINFLFLFYPFVNPINKVLRICQLNLTILIYLKSSCCSEKAGALINFSSSLSRLQDSLSLVNNFLSSLVKDINFKLMNCNKLTLNNKFNIIN